MEVAPLELLLSVAENKMKVDSFQQEAKAIIQNGCVHLNNGKSGSEEVVMKYGIRNIYKGLFGNYSAECSRY